jgi:hypothetical protein
MLGSVMAVSGAAASPNWGFHTSTAIAFLLTLFNVRLGRWCPNPGYPKNVQRQTPLFGAGLLLQELFGQTDDKSKYVYLSDGGHFDNLGIYELVRRRVKTIVVCDCGQDLDTLCDDIADAFRKCYSDFGVVITANVEPLKKHALADKDAFSTQHIVVGRIAYPAVTGDGGDAEAFEGRLVIVKPTLREQIFASAPDVRNYALSHKEFPQQTTLDQFFDEAQFESYRKLGYLIGRSALTDPLPFGGSGSLSEILKA